MIGEKTGLLKIVGIILVVLNFNSLCQAQSFERYTQEIKGLDISFKMEAIPGGEFIMGNNNSEYEDEKPEHKVKVDSFYMSTYEVPWELYKLFAFKDSEKEHSEGSVPDNVEAVTRPTKPYLGMNYGMGEDGYPAVGMTQYNAIQFAKWLYEHTGIFYRLPTEAEWEYASRGGTNTKYFFGNTPDELGDYAWFIENSNDELFPVGEKKPNPFGLYDILGNAAEWTYDQYIEDFYKEFEGEIADNPVATPTELYPRSARGGSYRDPAEDLTSSRRGHSDPSWKEVDPQMPKSQWWLTSPIVGVRLVRPLKPPTKEEIEDYYNEEAIEDF